MADVVTRTQDEFMISTLREILGEDTTGVNASEHASIAQKIDAKLRESKSDLIGFLELHFQEFLNGVECTVDFNEELKRMTQFQATNLPNQEHLDSLTNQLSRQSDLKSAISEQSKLVSLLQLGEKIMNGCSSFNDQLKKAPEKAVQALSQMVELLSQVADDQQHLKFVDMLKVELGECQKSAHALADHLCKHILTFEGCENQENPHQVVGRRAILLSNVPTPWGSTISINQVWALLEGLKILPSQLTAFTSQLETLIIHPFCSTFSLQKICLKIQKMEIKNGNCFVEIRKEREGDQQHDFGRFFSSLKTLFAELRTSLFTQTIHTQFFQLVKNSLLNDIHMAVFQPFFERELRGESVLTKMKLESAVEAVRQFDEFLVLQGFCMASSFGLTSHLSSLDSSCANALKETYLSNARNQILNEYGKSIICAATMGQASSTSSASDFTSPLLSETGFSKDCKITSVAIYISHKTKECIKLTDQASPACLQALLSTTHDLFDLFRVLVPVVHHQAVSTVPQLGMLLHNDCTFMCHNIISLQSELNAKHFECSGGELSLASMSVLLEALGSQTFSNIMDSQTQACTEIVERTREIENEKVASERLQPVEQSFKALGYQLNQISRGWKDVLPSSVHEDVMSILFDHCLFAIMETIQTLEIREHEAYPIAKILTLFLEENVPSILNNKIDMLTCHEDFTKFIQKLES